MRMARWPVAVACAAVGAGVLYWYIRRRRQRKPKLILHFDVNETILVGDPAGGDTFEDCLNKMICKNAFVRSAGGGLLNPLEATKVEQLVWWDGTPLGSASTGGRVPALITSWEWPDGCVPFYKILPLKKKFAKSFTEAGSPGHMYRPVYNALEKALRLPETADAVDPRLTLDGVHHFLLPAFYETLESLHRTKRNFSLVIRSAARNGMSYGTDGAAVAEALRAWAEGAHPTVRGVPSLAPCASAAWRAEYAPDGTFTLKPQASDAGVVEAGRALAESAAVHMMEASGDPPSRPRATLCRDDYSWWKQHAFLPSSGKPLWLTVGDSSAHHLFFDDNIHNDANDSIVAVRVRETADAPFVAATGEATRKLHGICLVRCPTLEPILRTSWFLEKIDAAEQEREKRFNSTAKQLLLLEAS